MMTRRQALSVFVVSCGAPRAPGVPAQSADDQWFAITGDDGKPVPNMRLPVEVASEVDELDGAIWVGSPSREITLVEFFDYNCPYCRKAMPDLHGLMQDLPDLRLGLVNNAILSPASEEVARIEMAVVRLSGHERAYEFHRRLFERRGVIDCQKALDVGSAARRDQRACRHLRNQGRALGADAPGRVPRDGGNPVVSGRRHRPVRLSRAGVIEAHHWCRSGLRADQVLI